MAILGANMVYIIIVWAILDRKLKVELLIDAK